MVALFQTHHLECYFDLSTRTQQNVGGGSGKFYHASDVKGREKVQWLIGCGKTTEMPTHACRVSIQAARSVLSCIC